jgi:beta-glucosidase
MTVQTALWQGDDRVDQQNVLQRMNLRDKIAMCSGADFWHTKEMPSYGIPSLMMADGPHGLRLQQDKGDRMGIHRSAPATCFPAAVTTACSWDETLVGTIARAIAREAVANGVGLLLGPGLNIKRNPLCGRNFEYFAEDPLLAGRLAAAFVRAAEDSGIATCLKHFACNNQEYKRFSSDSILDERTLREIYLAGFEIAVKEGRPSTVMCAYNKINGVYCSDSKRLLTDILRTEWGFDGAVITDWGAMHDRILGFKAGCDLSMPGGSDYMEAECVRAVADGSLAESAINRSADRILRLIEKTSMTDRPFAALAGADAPAVGQARQNETGTGQPASTDWEAHHILARQAAEESAVLLKNDKSLLPVSLEDAVLIGHMASDLRYQGTGSSHINPWKLTQVTELCPEVPYVAGCLADGSTHDVLLVEAAAAAASARTAIVFAGLPDLDEAEGYDRAHMKMPQGHVRLIEAVAAVNPQTIVVLLCGSPVEMPWAEQVKAILYLGLPGQAGAEAIVNLLTGKAVPCGKLAESWPIRYEDCVSAAFYGNGKKDAHYREGLYVGYRYYASAGVRVRYPFGYGLSYSNFTYADLEITGWTVSCRVTNTGAVAAKEIIQLYVTPPQHAPDGFYRPERELKAFRKIVLQPGEGQTVRFTLDERSFAIWDESWVVPAGVYTIRIGHDSENLPLTGTIDVAGTMTGMRTEKNTWYEAVQGVPSHIDWERLLGRTVTERMPEKGRFTLENSVLDMKSHSWIMRGFYKVIEWTIARDFGGRKARDNPHYRMVLTSAANASLSSMKINGGLRAPVMEALLEMANGHYGKALKVLFCGRDLHEGLL